MHVLKTSVASETLWAAISWQDLCFLLWEGKASKKAQWLSGLQGRETHFIFLLHWQAGSWGCEKGAKPGCFSRTVKNKGSRATWNKWCRAHSGADTKCLLMLYTFKILWFSLFGVWMFGVCFSSLLTENVSLKREAVYHSTCSTYAALAILSFLPA